MTIMLELHVISRKTEQLVGAFAIGDNAEILIGRDADCDVRISAASVSREHCIIEQVDGEYYLRDLDSSGGTLLNGEPIDDVRLEHGLEVEVGPTTLRFVDE
ncbi:MAG: FHA domain-containing protein [Phycisphaerales bacterium]|jgi:pSer/pThr/pTyr-binding forkhead associated (FHA) protein|nr:FHA domain-containing protein [Phycisphaerales bacterium]